MVGLLEQVEFEGCLEVEWGLLWGFAFAFEDNLLLLVSERV